MDFQKIIPGNAAYFQEGFRKNRYPDRFEEYCRLAEPAFTAAVSGDGARLVEWMETAVKGLFRKRQRLEQAFFLLQYVVPAALHLGYDGFAAELRESWNTAHPECKFGEATFEQLNGSFRTTILGFKVD